MKVEDMVWYIVSFRSMNVFPSSPDNHQPTEQEPRAPPPSSPQQAISLSFRSGASLWDLKGLLQSCEPSSSPDCRSWLHVKGKLRPRDIKH